MRSEYIRKWILTVSLAVLAVAAATYVLGGAIPSAVAQQAATRTASCDGPMMTPGSSGGREKWMNLQLAAGKTSFVVNSGNLWCAW
jgi:hypothetical protein